MDEDDGKQMEGVFFFSFFLFFLAAFLLCYLPVTQVDLSRCIVGRLCEYMPRFLRLRNDHDGLTLKFGPVVSGLVHTPRFLFLMSKIQTFPNSNLQSFQSFLSQFLKNGSKIFLLINARHFYSGCMDRWVDGVSSKLMDR